MQVLKAGCLAVIAVVAAVSGGSVCAQEPKSTQAIDRARLEAFVDGTVRGAMRADRIAGVTVAVVDRSGPLLIKGYGEASPGRAVTPDTLFPVQSISKTMVWIALMQLVEQRRISLDDPINSHLPKALQIPNEGFDKPILIRHLMEHTAGFEESALGHLIVDREDQALPFTTYLAKYRVHRVRAPGETVVYSNYGASLAGAIVSEVSGLSWEDYADQKILRPLGMRQATFRQPYSAAVARSLGLPSPMPPEVAAQLTEGFRPNLGRLEVGPREFTNDPPSGALSASASDMSVYMRALLDPALMASAGVLNTQTTLELREPLGPGIDGFGALRHGFASYALPGGAEGFGHAGDSVYQVSDMIVVPALGIGVFVSANTPTGADLVHHLAAQIISEFEGEGLPPPRYGPTARAEAMNLSGTYRNLRRPYYRTERGLYDLFIDTIMVSAATNGDLLFAPGHASSPGSGHGSGTRLVPLGHGMYRDLAGPDRVAFRQTGANILLYDPAGTTVWERIGFFDSRTWIGLVSAATALGALLIVIGFIRGLFARPWVGGIDGVADAALVAASVLWIAGFALFAAFLVRLLSSETLFEVLHWYPAPSLVWGCWAFAGAAAFSLLALPSLAVAAHSGSRPAQAPWRKACHVLTSIVFLTCAVTFLRLNLLGFWGW